VERYNCSAPSEELLALSEASRLANVATCWHCGSGSGTCDSIRGTIPGRT